MGQLIPTHTKTYTHHCGCGFLVGVGVGMNSDTHEFTHDSPYQQSRTM